jgi:hypothetical protein
MVHPTPIWLKNYEVEEGQHKSPKTEFKSKAKWVEKPCKLCGKNVRLTESKAEKYWAGYCSKECSNKAKKTGFSIRKKCLYCGKEFGVRPIHEKKAKFCSTECHGKARRKSWSETDKHLRQSWEYKKWKAQVNLRDQFVCQDCRQKNSQIAHHLDDWNFHPEKRFEIDNGLTLCRKCHAKRHKKDLNFS